MGCCRLCLDRRTWSRSGRICGTQPSPGSSIRMVLVAATSDRPALERYKAVLTATSIAEYFRDKGKRVLLVIDSMTRVARALREVGLAAGEPPVRRVSSLGFCGSSADFRAHCNAAVGSITSFYTVLVEGNDTEIRLLKRPGHCWMATSIVRAYCPQRTLSCDRCYFKVKAEPWVPWSARNMLRPPIKFAR